MSTFCLLQIANVRDRDWFTWTYFVFPKTISGYDKPSEMRNNRQSITTSRISVVILRYAAFVGSSITATRGPRPKRTR